MTIDPNYTIDWLRLPIPKDRLAKLNQRSDAMGWVQAGGHLASMLATALLSWFAWSNGAWGWLVVALFLHGSVCAFCINAVHELVHGTVFKTSKLNELFAAIFAYIGWINHRAFWASHAEHHRYTLHAPYDGEVVVPITITLRGFLRTFFDPLAPKWLVKHHWKVARGHYGDDWSRHVLEDNPRRFDVFTWSRILLVGHAATTIISLSFGLWIIPIIISLTPMYGKTLQFLLNNTQHVGLQKDVSDFRINCRTFHTNALFRFLYWQMNYHIEHHMYAAVPCYNLKKLNEEISLELPHCCKGLVEVWWHIIAILYRQKHEPGYVFVPVLPGQELVEEHDLGSDTGTPSNHLIETVESAPHSDAVDGASFKIWECTVCGFIYDEKLGLPEEGLAPGTRWHDIAEDWCCPDCGVAKSDFEMKEFVPAA